MYLVVRLASWSERHCKGKSGKVSGGAIKVAVAENAWQTVEFIDVLSGRVLNVLEAKAAGVDTLNVRFNSDRSVVVVKI